MRTLMFGLACILCGCRVEEKPSPHQNPPASVKQATTQDQNPKEYTFNDQEIFILENVLRNEFLVFAKGGDALLSESKEWEQFVRVSSDSLQINYDANEVLGDRKYRNKTLAVSGVVASIDRGIGDNYFVALRGGHNMFVNPHAQMADGFTDYLAGLKKGQKINLVCTGDGMLLGSATLNNCQPVDNWVSQKTTDFLDSIDVKIKSGDKFAVMVSFLSIALASKPNSFQKCLTDSKQGQEKCVETGLKSLDSLAFASAGMKMNLSRSDIKKMFNE